MHWIRFQPCHFLCFHAPVCLPYYIWPRAPASIFSVFIGSFIKENSPIHKRKPLQASIVPSSCFFILFRLIMHWICFQPCHFPCFHSPVCLPYYIWLHALASIFSVLIGWFIKKNSPIHKRMPLQVSIVPSSCFFILFRRIMHWIRFQPSHFPCFHAPVCLAYYIWLHAPSSIFSVVIGSFIKKTAPSMKGSRYRLR